MSNAYASREWTDQERVMGWSLLALNAIDFKQTSYAMGHNYHETNPMIGSHPSNAKLAALFLATSITGYYVLDYFDDHRTTLLYIGLGVKAAIVGNHIGIGLKLGF